jgi:hypothetical protein
MAVFPPNGSKHIPLLTNGILQKNKGKDIELGELLWFFGVVPLNTGVDFGQRHELWNAHLLFLYIPSHQFRICTGI